MIIAKQTIKQIKEVIIKYFIVMLSILILFTLFFISGPNYYSKPSFIQLWNIGHIIFFTLSNYLIIKLLRKESFLFSISTTLIFTLALGVIIEVLQSKLDRSVDWKDIYRDLLGAGLALALFQPSLKRNIKKIQHLFLIFICSLILFDQRELYYAMKNEIQAQINFPILADFEEPYELTQWSGYSLSQSQEHQVKGQYSMKVHLLAGSQYSGFTFEHFPRNWKNYQHLSFSLYNPDKTQFKLNIRITDYAHDNQLQSYNNRFNKQIRLEKDWNHISIPLKKIMESPRKRTMDSSDMSQIGFFTIYLQKDKILYIDDVKLIK